MNSTAALLAFPSTAGALSRRIHSSSRRPQNSVLRALGMTRTFRVIRSGSFSEQCRSDSNHRGAFLDRDLIVVAHAHGELAQPEALDAGTQSPEIGANVLGILKIWWDRHQAPQVQIPAGANIVN